jgi:hypothetical protein
MDHSKRNAPTSINSSSTIDDGRLLSSTWLGAPFSDFVETIGIRSKEAKEEMVSKKDCISQGGEERSL